jgi:hypothetical protein
MWGRVDLVRTDVSEERVDSIFKVEKTTSEEKLWQLASKLSPSWTFSTLKATRSSETSILTRPTRHHVPVDGILHIRRCERFEIYTIHFICVFNRSGSHRHLVSYDDCAC